MMKSNPFLLVMALTYSSAQLTAAELGNIAPLATATTSYVSPWETLSALNDDLIPSHSNDKSNGAYGNWNNPNSIQWVEYQWPSQYNFDNSDIYWFDDDGGVRIPSIAYLEYWNGSSWVNAGNVPRQEDAFNTLSLAGISSDRLRISMLNPDQSTGILEWRVFASDATSTDDQDQDDQPNTNLPYQAVSNEYTYLNTNQSNALYQDSDRFRLYYAGNGKTGGEGNLSEESSADIEVGLAHLEAAYDYFVTQWGFRSSGLSIHSDTGPYYKLNLYATTTLNAGGVIQTDQNSGLCFIEVREGLFVEPSLTVHEFGHCLTYSEYNWVNQGNTGAWWETLAEWVNDAYTSSPAYDTVRAQYNLPVANSIFNPDVTIAQSYLTIVHANNLYQAWPFFAYLTNNPDNFPGLGKMAVLNLMRQHKGNNETPLHVLARLSAPTSVQQILGRYWARMAYVDIGNPKAQQTFINARSNTDFKNRAYANLDPIGNQTYRVKSARRPMYAGANITPLRITGDGHLSITISNLGNGLSDSNYTATLAIRNSDGTVRYVDLPNGSGQANLSNDEEASLVVVNTPDNLYMYNAFTSTSSSDESIGLNYHAEIIGAEPERQ